MRAGLCVVVLCVMGKVYCAASESTDFFERFKKVFFGVQAPVRPTAPDELHVGMITLIDETITALEYMQQLDKFAHNDDIHAVLVYCNSSGGAGGAALQIASLLEYVGLSKPVVAYIENSCLSSAYVVACGADIVVANQFASIGSIGVMTEVPLRQSGSLIYAGKYKCPRFDAHGELDADFKRVHQERINQLYAQQCVYVAGQRGLSAERVESLETRTFAAPDALREHLIDVIGNLFDALVICRDLADQRGLAQVSSRHKVRLSGPDIDVTYVLPHRTGMCADYKRGNGEL